MTDSEQRLQHLLHLQRIVDLDELLDDLLATLHLERYCDGFFLALIDPEGSTLSFRRLSLPAAYRALESTWLNFEQPLADHPAAARAVGEGRWIQVDRNVQDTSDDAMLIMRRWNMSSMACIPVIHPTAHQGQLAVAVLMVYLEQGQLAAATIEQLSAALQDYSGSLFHLRLADHFLSRQREVDHVRMEMQDFVHFVSEINKLADITEVLPTLGSELLTRFRFDMAAFLLVENQELHIVHSSFAPAYQSLEANWARHIADTRFPLDPTAGSSPIALLNNERILVPDAQAIMHLPLPERDRRGLEVLQTPRTVLIEPIRRHGKAIGVIWLISLGAPNLPSQNELALLELLSHFAGSVLYSANLYGLVRQQKAEIEALNEELRAKIEDLRVLATKDRLTALYNLASFEEELSRRVHSSRRSAGHPPLSLVILDVDHFKHFNDTYGHLAGNEVLRELAQRMRLVARDSDFPARYGGEEFAVVLPMSDLDGAVQFAERLRSTVGDTPFRLENGTEVAVTISVGCAELHESDTPDQLVARADHALYAAKHAGRNRVMASPMPV